MLKLKAEVESRTPHFSFKRLVPGGFDLGLKGSTCIALPRSATKRGGGGEGVYPPAMV